MPLLDTPTGPIAYDEQGAGNTIVLLPSGAHDRHDFDALRALIPRTLAHDRARLARARRVSARRRTGERDAPGRRRRGGRRATRARRRGRPRQLGGRILSSAPGDPSTRAGQGPGDRRRRRLRRTAAARAGVLRPDGAAPVPASDLPRLLRALHASAHRRGPSGAGYRRDHDQGGSGPTRRQRAVAQLRLPRARPAPPGAVDRSADPGDLGPPRSRSSR